MTRKQNRALPAAGLDSYSCVLLGYTYFEVVSPQNHLRARDCLEQAVVKDTEYAEAWGWLAVLYAHEFVYGFNPRPDPLERAMEAANKAVEADPNSQKAWEGKAGVHYFLDEREEFEQAARRAVAINPNDVSNLAVIGFYLATWGNYDEGIPLLQRAIDLSPFPQWWYYYPFWEKAYREGDFDKALEYAHLSSFPALFWDHLVFAAIYIERGEMEKAEQSIGKLLELNPDVSENFVYRARLWNWPEDLIEKIAQALESAGITIQRGAG